MSEQIVQLNEQVIKIELKELVRQSVQEVLNNRYWRPCKVTCKQGIVTTKNVLTQIGKSRIEKRNPAYKSKNCQIESRRKVCGAGTLYLMSAPNQ